jgi:hypothetical protein
VESPMPARKTVTPPPAAPAAHLRGVARAAAAARRDAAACADLASLPVQHAHAAGIDVGDATHWVCRPTTTWPPSRASAT